MPLGASLDATLWIADERTLVFALHPRTSDPVPSKAESLADRFFAPSVRKLLAENLVEGTPAWLIGSAHDWTGVLHLPYFENWSNADRQMLSQWHIRPLGSAG